MNIFKMIIIFEMISEGRLEADTKSGQIFSRKIRGKEGTKVRLEGSNCSGYRIHCFRFNGMKFLARAHQIVWIYKNGLIPDELEIDHKNRIRSDNRIINLRLVTKKENYKNQDRSKIGVSLETRKLIFDLRKNKFSLRDVALLLGYSKSRIHQIEIEGIL